MRSLVLSGGAVVAVVVLASSVLVGCSDPPDRERVDAAIAAGPSDVEALVRVVAEEGITEGQAEELLASTDPDRRSLPGAVLDAIAEAGTDGEPSRHDSVDFARHLLEADGEGTLRAAADWVDGLLAPVYGPSSGPDDRPVSRRDLAALVAHAAPALGVLAAGADEGDVAVPGDDDLGPEATCRYVANVARELAVDALVEAGVVDGELDVEGRVGQLVGHLGDDTYAELRTACVDSWSATADD